MKRKIAVTSSGMRSTPHLATLLGAEICRPPLFGFGKSVQAVAGWGMKKSGVRAEAIAQRLNVPVMHLEDGFLRSIRPGREDGPLSIVKDIRGIYYDSTRPSSLEELLSSDKDLLQGIKDDVKRAMNLIVSHRLSKYNHAPDLNPRLLKQNDRQRILVIDQTAGDTSILLGGATAGTFGTMLQSAIAENPGSTVYVKTHPEVSLGSKKGHFYQPDFGCDIVMLREAVNPISLILQMDKIYTVSSTMGFEALLADRPVVCFGVPWYSGWGVTDDRKDCARRFKNRSVEELFAAAYFHYTTYLNPYTERVGTIFDVISWLRRETLANRVET